MVSSEWRPGRSLRPHRLAGTLALASMIGMLGVACSTGAPESGDESACGNGQTLVINLPQEPSSLDGNYDTLVYPAQVNRNIYDSLFVLDEDFRVQPSLATGFEQPDDVTYVLSLRDDVTFHDGSAFTSADVVNNFDRIANDSDLASRQRSYVSNVSSVEAIDDYTVKIELIEPDASFVRALASLIFITPKDAIEEVGGAAFAAAPVGSGPFVFDSWVRGDRLKLTANCDYWQGPPQASAVEFRFIAEPATAVAALQSGEIDMAPFVNEDLAAALASDPQYSVEQVPSNRVIFVSINTLDGPVSDVRVRQALNFAIDRESITQDLLGGAGVPIGQPATEGVFGFSSAVEPYAYDPDRARELLADAGHADDLTLTFYNHKPEQDLVWQAVAGQLEDVGIAVELVADENYFSGPFLELEMEPTGMLIQGCSSQLMDADYCLGLAYDSERRGLYYHTQATDDLIHEARSARDDETRQAIYDELMPILHDDAPVIFLYSPIDLYAMSAELQFNPRSDQAIWLWDVTKEE